MQWEGGGDGRKDWAANFIDVRASASLRHTSLAMVMISLVYLYVHLRCCANHQQAGPRHHEFKTTPLPQTACCWYVQMPLVPQSLAWPRNKLLACFLLRAAWRRASCSGCPRTSLPAAALKKGAPILPVSSGTHAACCQLNSVATCVSFRFMIVPLPMLVVQPKRGRAC